MAADGVLGNFFAARAPMPSSGRSVEARFPALKDRISTMLIPGGSAESFKSPETAEEIRNHVRTTLRLPEKRD